MNKIVSSGIAAVFLLNAGLAAADEPSNPETICRTVERVEGSTCRFIMRGYQKGINIEFLYDVPAKGAQACTAFFEQKQKEQGRCVSEVSTPAYLKP